MNNELSALSLHDALEKLTVHDHLCMIYANRREQFAALIPFIRAGLERGERCFYIADENTAESVVAAMRDAGIAAEEAVARGSLVLLTSREVYLRNGRFEPEAVGEMVAEAIRAALAEGFTGLRVTGEMTWALGGNPGCERLLEYEAFVNAFLQDQQCLALCQYSKERFSGDVLRGVIRTHPIVVAGGTVYANPHFLLPEQFRELSELAREVKRLEAEAAERQRALEALRQSEAELASARHELGRLAAGLLAAQEEERSRLARELHDDLNQRLAMLALRVETLQRELPPNLEPMRAGMESLGREVAALSDDVRRISHQLHPSILEDLGLSIALKSLCQEFSQVAGLKVSFQARNVPQGIDPASALCLYRVAQEALRNVATHSGAVSAAVRLSGARGVVSLTVTDRGAGFDPARAVGAGGLGLLSMQERVRLLNGTISISSQPGKGTRIEVRLPVKPPPR